jgi:hypothetical protein
MNTRKDLFLVTIFIFLSNISIAQKFINPIDEKYIQSREIDSKGNELLKIRIPGSPPPKVYSRKTAALTATTIILSDVPALSWSFGCTATSAAMAAGYYDRTGYSNMYAGPTNGGVFPLNNSSWGTAVINTEIRALCPLSATRNGLDGRTTRGHVDDFWVKYNSPDDDPYITNGWTQHAYGDCTGDYMKTNQSAYGNTDGSTTYYFNSAGGIYSGTEVDDGPYGFELFMESRGYNVVNRYNQTIVGYNGNTAGFSFDNFKTEIIAGRPVMIHVEGHTMLGIGYDDASQQIYIHNTWDYSTYTMTWGGVYEGMQHLAVSVFELEPIEIYIPTNFLASSFSTSQIDLSWNLNAGSDPVLIAWSPTGTIGTPVNGTTYSAGNSIPGGGTVLYYGTSTGYSHTSLSSGTTYYYKAWSNVSGTYSSGIERNATTDCNFVSTFPFTENFTAGIQPNCWTQVDHAGNGQLWQFGTFTETQAPNPTLTGNYAYLNSDNYGSGYTQNADLVSPVFNFKNQTNIILSFKHFFQYYNPSIAMLSYSINNGASWTSIQTWTTSTSNPATFSQNLTTQVAGYEEVLFKWNYVGTWAWFWAIDDVSITTESTVLPNLTVTNKTLIDGQYDCWNALENVTVAGPTYSVVLQNGSEANFIAGESINFLPGFHAQNGSTMHAYITQTGDYCNTILPSPAEAPLAEKSALITDDTKPVVQGIASKTVKVYPNPNNGRFVVELTNFEGISEISIINTSGALISKTLARGNKMEFDQFTLQKGLYFITIKNGESITSRKFVVQ